MTVLNFGRKDVAEEIDFSGAGGVAGEWTDALTGQPAGRSAYGRLPVLVPALGWLTLIGPPPPGRQEVKPE